MKCSQQIVKCTKHITVIAMSKMKGFLRSQAAMYTKSGNISETVQYRHCYCRRLKVKVKVKVGFLYSATYMVDQEQPRALTISEVAVDWQEPMVLQRKCCHPLPAQTDIGPAVAASKHTIAPNLPHAAGLHPVSSRQVAPLQPK